MSNRDMKLDVLVNLHNRMTPGVNRIVGEFDRIGRAARKIGAVGGILAGLSFMGPMHEAAAFEQQLIDIAGTAELTGRQAFRFVDEARARYEQMAFAIGQSSETIAAGAGRMIAAGVDVRQVDESIRDIGAAATAANAEFNDMAGVAQSMMLNLKVPAEDVRNSLSALVVAGKSGSFELKDMAREFPNLTSQVARFGITGREAVNFLGSGLQIAMKGAAQTSVAANNFSNFLAKALAPRTVKNFEEMGVNIQEVMQDAAARGINPLEAMLQKVQTLTGVTQSEIGKYMARAKANGLQGAEALGYVRQQLEKIGATGKITQLFNDQQVLDFIVPMMANMEEYKSIKADVASATGAATDADFETQMQGINRQMTIFKEVGTQASREVGMAFGGWLPMVNSGLMALIRTFREQDAATGGWLKKALSLGAGAVLLAAGIGVLGLALPLVTAGFTALGAVIGIILSPIGLLIGLLAGAGYLIWKNWDKVAPRLAKFWDSCKRSGLKTWEGIKSAWANMMPWMTQMWDRVSSAAGQAWDGIRSKASGFFSGIDWDAAGSMMISAYAQTLRGLGAAWEWLKQVWEAFKPSLEGIGQSLQRTFGSLGSTWENIKGIGSGLMDIASAIAKLLGFGDGAEGRLAVFLGQLAGGFAQLMAFGIEGIASAMHVFSGALRTIVDLLNGKTPDWKKYFPKWLLDFVNNMAGKIREIREFFQFMSGSGSAPAQEQLAAQQQRINQLKAGERETLGFWPRVPNSDLAKMLPQPQAQRIDNKVQVHFRADVPGTATATVNSTRAAPVTVDGGLAVGRP